MTLLVPWLVFPLGLAALSYGCGLLLARTVPASRLPGALVLPVGFAGIVCAGELTTMFDATAELTTPAVVALACMGLGLSRRRPRLHGWAAGCAVAAFLAYGAPVLLSGDATFAGYVKLDDTATFLAITDRVMEHGRDLNGLAPSSYEATLAVNLANGYPTGALVPLGIGSQLTRSDPAWTYQPYLAFLGGMLALSLYAVGRSFVRSSPLRASVAVVAAQPALLFGMAQWGGVKEMFAAALVALAAASVPLVRRGGGVLISAITAAALLNGLSAAAVTWLGPLAVGLAVLAWRRVSARWLVVGLVASGVLALPSLVASPAFLRSGNRSSFQDPHELGNLVHPLSALQLLGIWPSGDFRWEPGQLRATHVLLAVTAGAAAFGLVVAIRRRGWSVVVYSAACLTGTALVAARGSPWLEAKTYAVAAPAVVLLALGGAVAAIASRRRVEGFLLLAAVAGGVLWSNLLAYRDVSLAPRDELAELQSIGTRFAGQGPALMTEYQPYGVRHFLRRLDAEGASELRRRQVPLRTRRLLVKAEYVDLDQFAVDGVLVYRTLVLRRSPTESRPPLFYKRMWSGRFYDVWQRPAQAAEVLADLPLGTNTEPAAKASCAAVLQLARTAQAAGGRLAAAPARQVIVPLTGGRVSIPQDDLYAIWVGGSFQGRLLLDVDSRIVATARPRVEHVGQYVELTVVHLERGMHRLRVRFGGADWRPGSRGASLSVASLLLTSARGMPSPISVAPLQARALCGRRFDWIEAVR